MIAVDTQVLVHGHRSKAPMRAEANALFHALATAGADWGIPAACASEFLRVATHPKVFAPPSTPREAVGYLDALLGAGGARLLLPGDGWWRHLRESVLTGRAMANLVFDAQIAAICLDSGVGVLITDDSDFGRFPLLRTARLSNREWRKWVK